MLGRYTLANNVKVTLAADVSAVASSITVNAASGIFNNPPDPTGDAASGGLSIATIQDAALPPTKTEIITYTGVTDNGNGTLTLTGVLRGIEGTTARSWATGAVLFQAYTAGQRLHPKVHYNLPGAGSPHDGLQSEDGFYTENEVYGYKLRYENGVYYSLGVGGLPVLVLNVPKSGWSIDMAIPFRASAGVYNAPTSLNSTYDASVRNQLVDAMARIELMTQQIAALKADLMGHHGLFKA